MEAGGVYGWGLPEYHAVIRGDQMDMIQFLMN